MLWILSKVYVFVVLTLHIVYSGAKDDKCVKWGNTFDVSLDSSNVALECSVPLSTAHRSAVCCEAVKEDDTKLDMMNTGNDFETSSSRRKVGLTYEGRSRDNKGSRRLSQQPPAQCEITKEYIPSPYELYHLSLAKKIDAMPTFEARLDAVLTHVTSPEAVNNATRWLKRVALHMKSAEAPPETNDDWEFLSRFHVTRRCFGAGAGAGGGGGGGGGGNGNGNKEERVSTWNEWIEPLTISARHPFGFSKCHRVNAGKYFTKEVPKASRANADYVLLQSGQRLYNVTRTMSGRRIRGQSVIVSSRNDGNNVKGNTINQGSSIPLGSGDEKHYMLDAGTSTFDSSLFWFTCGYSQRRIAFDQVFAWEMTLLEPRDYWSRVPPKWKPYWHFYNVPISADPTHPDSPVRLIKSFANPSDFVSFKLDIDHPDTEMPIALSLLSDPGFSSLIDEFFFELHFQCEVMTSCGWGKRVPAESHGLKLDRSHVLSFFQDLRYTGIRAHIWP